MKTSKTPLRSSSNGSFLTNSEEQASTQAQAFNKCVRKFNESGKKGVAMLIEEKMIDGSSLSIAKFLFEVRIRFSNLYFILSHSLLI
jgi:Sec7-like guanine-nucleotide exchange factor